MRQYTDDAILDFIEKKFSENNPISLRAIANHFNTSHSQIKRILLRQGFYEEYLKRKEDIVLQQEERNDNNCISQEESLSESDFDVDEVLKSLRDVNDKIDLDVEELDSGCDKYKDIVNLIHKDKNNVAFISDIHLGHHDDKALNVALNYLKERKIKKLVIGGDLMDNESISFFRNRGVLSFVEEAELVKDFFGQLRSLFPTQNIFYISGNHECVEESTEILTEDGWVLAKDLNTKYKIAQFNMKTGDISFDYPKKISKFRVDKLITVKTWLGEERVTDNHCLIVGNQRKSIKQCMNEGLNQKTQRFAGYYSKNSVNLSNDKIKLLTWIITDCERYKTTNTKIRIQWKLSKQRKIDELCGLLDRLNIRYTFRKATKSGCNKLQPYMIRIYGKLPRVIYRYLKGKKQFPEHFKYLNTEQLEALLSTLEKTDGYKHYNHISWVTTNKNDVDVVQLACIFNNIPCKFVKTNEMQSGFKKNAKLQYRVYIFNNGISGKWADFNVENGEFNVVAITTKEETIITRVNGKINFTGNSRYENYILSHVKQLYELKHFHLEKILELEKYNIEWIDNRDYIKKYGHPFRIGNLSFLHGHEIKVSYAGVNIARSVLFKTFSNCIFGHFHQIQEYHVRTLENNLLSAYSVGCLCNLFPDYAPLNNWGSGFAIIQYSENWDSFKVYNKKIIDGDIY